MPPAQQNAIQAQQTIDESNKQRVFQAQQGAADRANSSANAAAGRAANTNANYQPMRDALNELGSTYNNSNNKQQFQTYKDGVLVGDMTREQAAYSLAAATGVTYEEALNQIYNKFK